MCRVFVCVCLCVVCVSRRVLSSCWRLCVCTYGVVCCLDRAYCADYVMMTEPALLLMAHSSGKYSAATASLLEFLSLQMEHFDPPRRDYIVNCTFLGIRFFLSVGVTRLWMPLSYW